MKSLLTAVWRYRYFILSSIKVDFRSRFVRSRLGGLWLIIHPLVQAATFALVLGQLLSGRLPDMSENKLAYAIYLLAGTLAWTLFTEVITRCLTVFIDNGNLLKKLVFPKICLPLIVTGSAIINNILLLGAVLAVFAVMGYMPGIRVFWVPILIVITLALSLGIGLILGTLNVFIRDIGQVVPIALQLGFWFTPIVYTPDIVPEVVRGLMQLNPMYWIVRAYQNAILYGTALPWESLGLIFLSSLMLLRLAMTLFRRARHEMVDVL
ncbi:MAG: ABC transporter permease [Leptolyngbyaceae cyanobacterium]